MTEQSETTLWETQARDLLTKYAKENATFTAPQAFRWAGEQGLSLVCRNKFGGTFRRALIDTNMVRVVGTIRSDEKQAKGRGVTVYESVICAFHSKGGDTVRMHLAAIVTKVRIREIDVTEAVRQAYEFGLTGRQQ